jgi:hypothetical protein
MDHPIEECAMNAKRWSIAILPVLAAGALAAGAFALETSTHILSGWWRGEAFYRGRPTSFWSKEMRHWRFVLT